MNDLAVVFLIFGNLMWSVHFEAGDSQVKVKKAMNDAINRYSTVAHHVPKRSSDDNEQGSGSFNTSTSPMRESTTVANSLSASNSNGDSRNPLRKSRRKSNPGLRGSVTSMRGSTNSMRGSANSVKSSSVNPMHNTPSKVSWGAVNESEFRRTIQEESGDFDNDSTDEETDIPTTPVSQSKRPVDVLKNNKASWGGVNFSTYERDPSKYQDTDDDDDEEEGSTEYVPDDEPEAIWRPPTLPQSKLPQERPMHMSYAESRISTLRNSHAKIAAERKGSKDGSKRGLSHEDGTDSTLNSSSNTNNISSSNMSTSSLGFHSGRVT